MDITLSGLIYVKHGRVGSRSEGPDYYLQTAQGEHLLRYQERSPWEPDYELEFHARRMVEVSGVLEDNLLVVSAIRPILSAFLPRPSHVAAAAAPLSGAPLKLQLKVGESAPLSGTDLRIEFVGITEDSRCPVGAVCMWEGQVTASLRAGRNGTEAQEVRLTLPGEARTVLGQRLTLAAVEPRRAAEAPESPLAYVITLQAERE